MISCYELNEEDPWSELFSAAAFAIHSTYHTTLEAMQPAQLVFGRDMLLPVCFKADWRRGPRAGGTAQYWAVTNNFM